MHAIRIAPLSAALLASFLASVPFAASTARAADMPHAAQGASVTCESARQFAWFQRQLRMGEGDTEPLQPAEPAECRTMAHEADAQGAMPEAKDVRKDSATPRV